MSWQTFKNNILQYANSPESLQDIDTVARIWATEYDAAIKRGGDVTNRIAIKQGDVESMTRLFKSALERGLTSKAPYDLVGEMGKGVIAYWQKATLNNLPVPIIPAPGTIANISITTAPVTNSGKWTPAVSIPNVKEPTEEELYEKLDFEKAGIDKNDPKVKKIIKFDVAEFEEEVARIPPPSEFESDTFPTHYTEDTIFEDSELAAGQLDATTAETLNEALEEQKIVPPGPEPEEIKSGYETIQELLTVAGQWARTLKKNARVKYSNLISGYKKGVHGLCAAGVKSVVCAMLGLKELGIPSNPNEGVNANDFSFKSGATGNFAKSIGGKKYYNGKIKIEIPFKEITNKKGQRVKVPNYLACYVGDSTQWRVGDILALDYSEASGRPYGHIQIYTGFSWQSDYKQNGVNGLSIANPETFALWRLNDNGAAQLKYYASKANSKKV
jgi:hypothetical protein